MGHSNGKITAPINLGGDVYPTLGIGATSNGYDLGYACANTHGKINKWSKYKPVRQPYLDYHSDYWKANDGLCGLSVVGYMSPGTLNGGFLKNLFDGVDWGYNAPTGGDSAPYRVLDFNGYNHNAIVPFGDNVPSDVYLDTSNNLEIQLEQTTNADDNILLSYLSYQGTPFSEMYAGVGLLQNTRYILVTSESMFTDSVSIRLLNIGGYVGKWKVSFFLSSNKIGVDDELKQGIYIPIPVTPKTMTIHAAGSLYVIEAFGTWNSSNNQITYNFIITNNSGSSVTIRGIVLVLMRTRTVPEAGESAGSLLTGLTAQVPAKGTYRSSMYSFNVSRDFSYDYYIAARATGVNTTYNMVEDYAP